MTVMSFAVVPALFVLVADGVLHAMGRKSLIERLLGSKYSNPYLRLPLVALYVCLVLFVVSDGFSSWPWSR